MERKGCCSKNCTNLFLYGVESPLQSEKLKKKRENTCLDRYGDPNYNNRNKAKQTMLEKYGADSALQNDEVKKKQRETILDKYGVDNIMKTDEAKKSLQETKLIRYGDGFYNNRDKFRETNLDRYGDPNYNNRDKFKETSEINWGVEHPMQSEPNKRKVKQTCLEKYGVENHMSSEVWQVENGRKFHSDQEIIDYIKTNSGKTIWELTKYFGFKGNISMSKKIKDFGLQQYVKYNDSHVNQHWFSLLSDTLNTPIEREVSIFTNHRCKADLFLPEFNIAIDINPTVSHSTQPTGHPHYQPKTVKYHQERALDAEANGYQLIQIYDWDDPDKIVALLQALTSKDKIGARQCALKSISKAHAKEFLNKHHRQGYGSARWCYGLFYEDTLVAVMTFGLGRFGHEGYELQRYASSIRIQGGQSRLFKAFVKDQDPDHVYSYVSLDTGTGRSYENFMTYKRLASLNGQYCHLETGHRIKATNQKGKRKDELNEAGYFRINDAGNKVFGWDKLT